MWFSATAAPVNNETLHGGLCAPHSRFASPAWFAKLCESMVRTWRNFVAVGEPRHTRAGQVRRIREIRRPQAAAITSQGAAPQLSVDGFSGFCGPDQCRLT